MEGGSIIDVHLNKLYEAGQTSMDRDPVERSGMSLRQRWKGPLKCLPCTAIIVERCVCVCVCVCVSSFFSPICELHMYLHVNLHTM